jgi:DNA-binding NarL/FixJ family response regulator
MSQIKLLVADDHTIIRNGICALLKNEPDFQIVGEAKTGREAVRMSIELSPDILIMDLAMPLLNGMEATRQVVHECPDIKIIVLSAYQDDAHMEASIAAGAAGYLLKASAAADIVQAVKEVHKGNAYFSPLVAERLFAKSVSRVGVANSAPATSLTIREAEVLQLIAEGFINKQIADELNISIKTVEKHRQSLMGKLNIHCTADLTRHAARAGVIELQPSKEIFSAAR